MFFPLLRFLLSLPPLWRQRTSRNAWYIKINDMYIARHVGIHAFMHEDSQAWRGRSPALHQGRWHSSNFCTISDHIKTLQYNIMNKKISKHNAENHQPSRGSMRPAQLEMFASDKLPWWWYEFYTSGILWFAAGLGANNFPTVQCRQHMIFLPKFSQSRSSSHKAVKITHYQSVSGSCMPSMNAHVCHECDL